MGTHASLFCKLPGGVRYGVRRYEYDSSQSEGNRYIRDNDL